MIPTPHEAPAFVREMIGLEPHDVIKVGEIEVEIVPVDHDAYGAAALLIRTPDHFIAYTGDLRLHGYHPERTKEFCQLAKHTDLLMMEGVSISFPERESDPDTIEVASEKELVAAFVELVEKSTTANHFQRLSCQCRAFLALVDACPRTIVLEAHQAALLKEIFDREVPYYTVEGGASLAELDPALEIDYRSYVSTLASMSGKQLTILKIYNQAVCISIAMHNLWGLLILPMKSFSLC